MMQWSDRVQEAFSLTYQGKLSQKQIAGRLGITDRTLRNWARDPTWKARYQAMQVAWDRAFRVEHGLRSLEEQERLEVEYEARHAASMQRLEAKRAAIYRRS